MIYSGEREASSRPKKGHRKKRAGKFWTNPKRKKKAASAPGCLAQEKKERAQLLLLKGCKIKDERTFTVKLEAKGFS